MGDLREWESYKHIQTRYLSNCKVCGRCDYSKNGSSEKNHSSCPFEMKTTPVPFCTICGQYLSLRQIKLQQHYAIHDPWPKNKTQKIKKKPKTKKSKVHQVAVKAKHLGIDEDLRDLLSSDYEDIVSAINMNFDQCNEAIKNNLLHLLSSRFPDVRVYTFGSREIGTATESSDLDVYVDTDKSYHIHGLDKPDTVVKILKEVEQILIRNSDKWRVIQIIDAKVPIIKACNKIENINCDISFSDGLAHKNTQLIKMLCKEQPIFRDMIIFLGQWLDTIGMSDQINKYTLRLLIMNYLQSNALLPSIKSLQKGIIYPAKIGPWNVDFREDINYFIKKTSDDLHFHIKGFFKLHSKAKRFNGIISTFLGTRLRIEQFGCKSFKDYRKFIAKYGNDEVYDFCDVNVQGPFNLADNPAKQVTKEQLQEFIHLSKVSFKCLTLKKTKNYTNK